MSKSICVVFKVEFYGSDRRGYWTATARQLGLVAYGQSRDGSLLNLKSLVKTVLEFYYQTGYLKQRLDHTGVKYGAKQLECPEGSIGIWI